MVTRRALLRTARLLVGATVLAQAALALAACEWSGRNAARAVAIAAASEHAPCQETGAGGDSPGLCLGHCLGDKQNLDKPSGALSTTAAFTLVVIVPPVSAIAPWHQAWRDRPLPAAAPPPRILFQSFQV